jgi:hypothetical protein
MSREALALLLNAGLVIQPVIASSPKSVSNEKRISVIFNYFISTNNLFFNSFQSMIIIS